MKIWVDDIREAPVGWIWCKSVVEAKNKILNFFIHIDEISLDHDAGKYSISGDYIKILDWLEELQNVENGSSKFDMSNITFSIHSMNPVGVENMKRIIKRNNWKYKEMR